MKKWSRLIVTGFIILLLTGCGQTASETEKRNSETGNSNSQTDIVWNTHTMKQQENFTDESGMYLTGYEEGWIQDSSIDYDACSTNYATFCGDFCALKSYEDGQGEDIHRWITMYYYDCDSKQTKTADISFDLWEMSSNHNVACLDIVSPERIAFAFVKAIEGTEVGTYETEECKVVFYDMEKGADGIVDIMPALKQAKVGISYKDICGASLAVDGDGNIYFVDSSEVVVIDEKGKLLTEMNVPGMDYVVVTGKTVSAKPLFYARSTTGGVVSFFCYDTDEEKMHSLGEITGYFSTHMAADGNGTIFCIESGDIVAWNSLTGEKRKLLNCKNNGICGNSMQVLLTYLSDGSLAVWDTATEESAIYYLTNEKLVEDCVITIDAVGYGWDLAKSTAAIFTRKTPGVTMEYVENFNDDAYKVKMYADFMEGKGADMLVIPYEDFLPLYENGLLADLSNVFDDETRTQVISQIWKPGTVDGKLYGLQDSNLYAISMIAPKKYVTEDGWTLDDVYKLMEEGTSSLQGISPLSDSPENLLYYMMVLNLPTRFIDYESGTCKFETEEFRKLLELCKDNKLTNNNTLYGGQNNAREVIEGNYLAALEYVCGLAPYGIEMNYYGLDYCYIGLPSDSGIGNIYLPSSLLVVNKNTEHMDIIKNYLNMLYSKPIQRKEYNCIRKDVLRENIIRADWDNSYVFDMGGGNYVQLETKSDGSTYVEDYFDFLDSTVPIPAQANEILSIIMEEAEGYLGGSKDLDKTVKVIQNRVQLMLDEMQSE